MHAVIAAGVYIARPSKPTMKEFKADLHATAKLYGGSSHTDLGIIGMNTNNKTGRKSSPELMEWAILSEHPLPQPGREGFGAFAPADQVDLLRYLFESDSQEILYQYRERGRSCKNTVWQQPRWIRFLEAASQRFPAAVSGHEDHSA